MAARNGRPVTDDVIRTGSLSVYELFAAQVARNPNGVAISQLNETWTYSVLQDRVRRTAALLRGLGIMPGQRIALMAENRHEYAEIELAAAMIGAIVACQNWRLADDELRHCINLVSPSLVIVSERYQEAINRLDTGLVTCLTLGDAYEQASRQVEPLANSGNVDPEDGLVILYTSGTTGLPKGALISHRAEIARMAVLRMDLNVTREDGFVAWAPMFHMGSTDQVLGALMSGATVHIVDGFNADRIVDIMEQHAIGWMLLMPGSIEPVVEILEKSGRCAKSIRAVGAMIDLVPLSLAAKLSRLTNAPYLNSFGATETGLAPASAMLIPPGEMPETLSKIQSSLCDVRLLDPDGHDVPYGTPAMAEAVGMVSGGAAPKLVQDESNATYEGWCRAADVSIDWSSPASEIYNLIRGSDPSPGATTTINGESIQFFRTSIRPGDSGKPPGEVIEVADDGFSVASQGGALFVQRVQPAGSGKVMAPEWMQAVGLKAGARFGT